MRAEAGSFAVPYIASLGWGDCYSPNSIVRMWQRCPKIARHYRCRRFGGEVMAIGALLSSRNGYQG